MQLHVKKSLMFFTFVSCFFISFSAQSTKLHHDQFGELVFAHSVKDTALTFHYLDSQLSDCQYVAIDKYPEVEAMLLEGIIVRVETKDIQVLGTDSPFYSLANNLMDLAAFKQAHPQVEVAAHEYENGYYLRWYNNNQSKAIVVDYVQGKVTNIKAGIVPHVLFVEGCA
ncbi:hypothetical protein RS130_23230 [Paraglaciecola aquimarina]|uniref:Uncharacterized protein n=1 Tax=Paraglaciecola aquimarina TaxID=1235557 RepID=A0ABU3T2H0_9ALTE|nr:hypothetical protein [Paraglaciecola aquimarina]MDU0356420.1 hypothetical protein [Paraglaciecola aquimarina]